MKHLTREERRRIQRRRANIQFIAFMLVLLAIGATIGYAAGRTWAAQEPPPEPEVSTLLERLQRLRRAKQRRFRSWN